MRTTLAITAIAAVAAGCGSGPSADKVCAHVAELFKKEGVGQDLDPAKCKEGFERIKKEHGDDVAAAVGKCTLAAASVADLRDCRPDEVKTAGSGGSSGGGGSEYVNKSKSTEARQFVKKLFDGARAYYMDEHTGGSMTPVPPQLPAPGVGPTPELGACCAAGGKCAPDVGRWTDPTWVALQFSVDDPHYYSYQYKPAADGKSFEVLAYGDLDCDGEYSTFKLSGKVEGDSIPMANLETDKELE